MRMNNRPMAYRENQGTGIMSKLGYAIGATGLVAAVLFGNLRDSPRQNILIREEMYDENPNLGIRYIDIKPNGRYDAGIDSVISPVNAVGYSQR